MGHLRLGIDIGGTFTDILLANEKEIVYSFKTPSVPSAPEQAIFNGLIELKRKGFKLEDIDLFIHGTTIGVNTLIERNGTKTGLIVTEGFQDVLEMRRLRLEDTTNLYGDKTVPLVPRAFVKEVRERTLASGQIHKPLDEQQLFEIASTFQAEGVQAVAISFLHAYKNSAHEEQAKAYLNKHFPDLYVSTSSEVWPQQREYERTLATVINAYIGKRMEKYFNNLIEGAQKLGLKANVLSTMSNGGVMTARSAANEPVKTLLSGPASGVIGAAHVSSEMNEDKIITFDMGGTSVDVSIVDGKASYSTENKVGDFPVIIPAIDVTAIGAGGGSIAWLDEAGILKVGPRSAGAMPGPACFGHGGERPTITDAYVELGFIRPEQFLSGKMNLYPELAKNALQKLGDDLEMTSYETAQAIIEVATSNMYSQFVPLLARRGVDTREFSILAYGGAGPTHAFILAREVGIERIIVPHQPGTLCAMGSVCADLKQDFICTVYKSASSLGEHELQQTYDDLYEKATAWIAREEQAGAKLQSVKAFYSADIRYVGQSFELEIEIDVDKKHDVNHFIKLFNEKYRALFGITMENADVAFINLRLTIVGETHKREALITKDESQQQTEIAHRNIYFDNEWQQALLINRQQLVANKRFNGPAIITSYDTTIFIPKQFEFYQNETGHLIGELQR